MFSDQNLKKKKTISLAWAMLLTTVFSLFSGYLAYFIFSAILASAHEHTRFYIPKAAFVINFLLFFFLSFIALRAMQRIGKKIVLMDLFFLMAVLGFPIIVRSIFISVSEYWPSTLQDLAIRSVFIIVQILLLYFWFEKRKKGLGRSIALKIGIIVTVIFLLSSIEKVQTYLKERHTYRAYQDEDGWYRFPPVKTKAKKVEPGTYKSLEDFLEKESAKEMK